MEEFLTKLTEINDIINSFHSPEILAFHGLCSAIVRRTGPGEITVSVDAKGLNDAKIILP